MLQREAGTHPAGLKPITLFGDYDLHSFLNSVPVHVEFNLPNGVS
jgi:hypothetical protein